MISTALRSAAISSRRLEEPHLVKDEPGVDDPRRRHRARARPRPEIAERARHAPVPRRIVAEPKPRRPDPVDERRQPGVHLARRERLGRAVHLLAPSTPARRACPDSRAPDPSAARRARSGRRRTAGAAGRLVEAGGVGEIRVLAEAVLGVVVPDLLVGRGQEHHAAALLPHPGGDLPAAARPAASGRSSCGREHILEPTDCRPPPGRVAGHSRSATRRRRCLSARRSPPETRAAPRLERRPLLGRRREAGSSQTVSSGGSASGTDISDELVPAEDGQLEGPLGPPFAQAVPERRAVDAEPALRHDLVLRVEPRPPGWAALAHRGDGEPRAAARLSHRANLAVRPAPVWAASHPCRRTLVRTDASGPRRPARDSAPLPPCRARTGRRTLAPSRRPPSPPAPSRRRPRGAPLPVAPVERAQEIVERAARAPQQEVERQHHELTFLVVRHGAVGVFSSGR